MRQRLLAIALALFVATLLAAPSRAHALDDPSIAYETITTPHFEVHYADGLDDLGRRVAMICEEAHEVLTPIMDWVPAARTHVFVSDRLDTANGSAQVYGRNAINFFGMPPESDSVLGYYDDWIRILVYHEYVHILHLDTIGGIPSAINAIFGKIYPPNQLMPRWYIEGLATYHESARTGTGRVNSALYQMWLRAELLREQGTLTLGQATNTITRWPFGSVAYLFGSFFLTWVSERHGESFLNEFNHLMGSRLIPYSMNQAARSLSGETWDELWQLWIAQAQQSARATQSAVQARGETALEFLTTKGGESKFPRVRPAHDEVSYFHNDMRSHPDFSSTSTKALERRTLFEVDAAAASSNWSPTGRHLIYSRRTISQNIYRYEDLFLWDSSTRTEVQLTQKERAREAAFSPDGKRVAYVRMRGGTMELVERGFGEGGWQGSERVLISGKSWTWDDDRHWQQLATPAYAPDGKSIVFSWWRQDLRQRDLWRYHLDGAPGERLEALMRDEAMDLDPHFGPDGLLYFSSDRSGIYNIHAMDLKTRERWQISEVLFGAFSPQVSPDGKWVYVGTYTSRGYDIARFARPTAPVSAAPRAEREASWRHYPELSTAGWAHADYTPRLWLKPLFITPSFETSSLGYSQAGVSVQGYDPLGRHGYVLSTSLIHDSSFDRTWANLALSYQFGGAPVAMGVGASRGTYLATRGLFAESTFIPYLERQHAARLVMAYPFASTRDTLTLSWGYTLDYRDYAFRPQINPEPGDLEPFEPELGWFNEASLGLSYSLLERYPYSVSLERGVSTSFNASVRSKALGSDYESLTLTYSVFGFAPLPKLERHALALSAVGGYITSDFRQRLQFSVGGNPTQNVLQSAIFQGGSSSLVVRGYPRVVARGSKYLVSSAEWRFPLLELNRGFSTTPFYLRQLKGRLFLDAGSAYSGFLADADLLMGTGGEILLTTLFGYYLGGTFRLGYARGLLGEDAQHDVYFLYGGGF